jgi:tetratricopeptide (TPR) repeat protein
MEDDDAVDLLLDAARLKPASDAACALAAKIVSELGNLALAVDQAGAYIARGECRLGDFLTTFERHRARLFSVDAYNRASPDARAVYATWELSYSAIERIANAGPPRSPPVEAARNAITLLNLLSYFHYENVTEDIFQRAAENPDRGFSYPADVDPEQLFHGDDDLPHELLPLDSAMKWDAHPFRKCISLLSSYSILWINRSSGTVYMHRLVHQWLFDRLQPDSRLAWLRSSATTLAASTGKGYNANNYAICRNLLPHAVALFQRAAIDKVDPLCNAYKKLKFVRILYMNGQWVKAIGLMREVLALRLGILGLENQETLFSLSFLASMLHQVGRVAEAEAMSRQAYEVSRRVFGPKHSATLIAMDNLATAMRPRGRPEAMALLRQVWCVKKRVLGAEHTSTIDSMLFLAEALRRGGRTAEAEAMLQQAYDLTKRVRGLEHPGTLCSMDHLSSALLQLGRTTEAESIIQQAYATRRRVMGSEHPHTLFCMQRVAEALIALGRATEAETLLQQAYNITKPARGPERCHRVITVISCAEGLAKVGYTTGDEVLCRKEYKIKKRELGPEHPETLHLMHKLAYHLSNRGRNDEAMALLKPAFDSMKRVLGPEDPATLMGMYNMACLLRLLGDADDAMAMMMHCYELLNERMGESHSLTREALRAIKEWLEEAPDETYLS